MRARAIARMVKSFSFSMKINGAIGFSRSVINHGLGGGVQCACARACALVRTYVRMSWLGQSKVGCCAFGVPWCRIYAGMHILGETRASEIVQDKLTEK